jgi:hypothetical protein
VIIDGNGQLGTGTSAVGTVTSVGSGAGLTGGPITTSGTLSIATGGVTNVMLANPSLTVTAGAGLTGGGSVALGGTVTLSNPGILGIAIGPGLTSTFGQMPTLAIDTSVVPFLATKNTFTVDQSLNAALNLAQTTGADVGVINVGGSSFIHECCFNSIWWESNTFIGLLAGDFKLTGTANTGMGAGALNNITAGIDNTADGNETLASNTTGSGNTALGAFSLFDNTTASSNTAVGQNALFFNCQGVSTGCAGSNNTAVGYNAGRTENGANANVTGANNTFIGYDSGPGTSTQLNNATAVGANALVSASNALVLGAPGVDVGIGTASPIATLQINENDAANADTLLIGNNSTKGLALFDTGTGVDISSYGKPLYINYWGSQFTILNEVGSTTGYVGIGTNSPDNLLTVNGSADKPGGGSWGTFSDARLKTVGNNFRTGLPEVLKLNPIYYRYKEKNALGIADRDEHVGFVAQEVEKVIPEAVTKDSQGYRILNNDPILWAMLNAIKQQQGLIQKQADEIKAQQGEVTKLQAQLAEEQKEREEQRAELSQVLAQVRVIQARLAGKSATRPRIGAAKNAATPAKTPKAAPLNTRDAVNHLVAKVRF